MKSKILNLCPVVLLVLILGASCQNDDIEYADESIEISTIPGISIYKTKRNYDDKLAVSLDTAGNISGTPLFGNNPDIVSKSKDGHFMLKKRLFLKGGFIIEDIALDYAFTDITITEMVETFTEYGGEYWSPEKYLNRIIDKDPFSEFFYLHGDGKPERIFTVKEINDLIENGTLETVFTKLK